ATQPYDAVVIAGDLCLFGPRPAEALARVRECNAPTIYGNTDAFLLDSKRVAGDPGLQWVHARIGDEGTAYLASLPFAHRIAPPGGTSPTDVDNAVITEMNPSSGSGQRLTPEDEAVRLTDDTRANLILYGHIHYASSGTVRGQRLASIGAVGFPFDRDQRAAYAIVTWDGTEWRVAHRRVAYDVQAVIDDLNSSGAPFANLAAGRLQYAMAQPPAHE
ncbi:MAG TPA: metallophosphoesterase family protein, partial [Thermomicrobiales bacterium]